MEHDASTGRKSEGGDETQNFVKRLSFEGERNIAKSLRILHNHLDI